jgi:hypothetical protein
MKADGGTLVYILIGLISVVISAVEKNRKKKLAASSRPASSGHPASETQEPPQPSWQKELEDIFGKSFDVPEPEANDRKQETPASTPQSEPKIYPNPKKVSQAEHWEKENAPMEPVMKSDVTLLSKNQASTNDETEFALVDFEQFDLRKAVIYNEVLNRKYF